ncbi:CpaD family pilus assembly lipoprotein [Rhizobium sp. CG5]|uniref:CpaD family pilus assembly protein n=1 Tax=Rhizobium sp. CG5 TaxID=2726076 RepID=UPI0020344602|nr:CpaD family pilus assembly protein [Rhizobium sp. CG5]MCM2473664.1 CpaD family pilus assembly lipoprotein [Rhizobium sp. CG5]
MRVTKATFRTSNLRQAFLAGAALAAVAVLSGCGTKDRMSTNSIPDDYRTRHPIVLTEVEHTLDIPLAAGDRKLTTGTRDAIAGFAQDYVASSSGNVQIMVPHGSANAGAATHISGEIRTLLAGKGVSAARIVETGYAAGATGDAAPVRLSYVATTAVTSQCGEWPEDIANDTMMNRNWHNFGCASQNNLAAQIANPMDLVAPRGMTPIDATRRSTVIGLYREGTDTSTD